MPEQPTYHSLNAYELVKKYYEYKQSNLNHNGQRVPEHTQHGGV